MSPSNRNRPRKVPYTKPPLSFSEQVAKLEQRGLIIPDKAKAEHFLAHLNYYRFAAYCLPFEQDHATHQFRANVRFDDILNLYIFDRELRLLMLDAIERFEVSLRSQLAYHSSHNHNSAHPHLKPELFGNLVRFGSNLSKLDNDIKRSKEDFIKHLTRKYEEEQPPIWAVVDLMTMGQLSKWFANIDTRADRQAISKIYNLDETVVTSFCEHLSIIRNTAAHHSRLWNRDFTVTFTLPRRAPEQLRSSLLVLADSDRRLRKLYNTFVMLAYLMNIICDENHWVDRLKSLINKYQIDTGKMGFPRDWQHRSIWQ